MRNRVLRVLGVVACGAAYQFAGCNSQDLADILGENVKSTAVEVSTFVVESVVDNALGLE